MQIDGAGDAAFDQIRSSGLVDGHGLQQFRPDIRVTETDSAVG
jgi:hypothetical protein